MTWDFHVTGDNDGGAQELFSLELREIERPSDNTVTEALRNAAYHLGFAFSHTHQVTIATRGYILASGVGSVTLTISVVPDFYATKASDVVSPEEVAP